MSRDWREVRAGLEWNASGGTCRVPARTGWTVHDSSQYGRPSDSSQYDGSTSNAPVLVERRCLSSVMHTMSPRVSAMSVTISRTPRCRNANSPFAGSPLASVSTRACSPWAATCHTPSTCIKATDTPFSLTSISSAGHCGSSDVTVVTGRATGRWLGHSPPRRVRHHLRGRRPCSMYWYGLIWREKSHCARNRYMRIPPAGWGAMRRRVKHGERQPGRHG